MSCTTAIQYTNVICASPRAPSADATKAAAAGGTNATEALQAAVGAAARPGQGLRQAAMRGSRQADLAQHHTADCMAGRWPMTWRPPESLCMKRRIEDEDAPQQAAKASGRERGKRARSMRCGGIYGGMECAQAVPKRACAVPKSLLGSQDMPEVPVFLTNVTTPSGEQNGRGEFMCTMQSVLVDKAPDGTFGASIVQQPYQSVAGERPSQLSPWIMPAWTYDYANSATDWDAAPRSLSVGDEIVVGNLATNFATVRIEEVQWPQRPKS
eukprot:scaffold6802_cov109-Isochrysis_galbana.AAC.2